MWYVPTYLHMYLYVYVCFYITVQTVILNSLAYLLKNSKITLHVILN